MNETCAECGTVAPLRDLLRVTVRATGRVRYVCRPNTGAQCFNKNVRNRAIEVAA